MQIKAVVLAVLCLCFGMVRPASAAFFDDSDGKWWMAADQWDDLSQYDVDNNITIADQNNHLEFSSNTTTADGDAFRVLISKWSLDLNSDFDISIDYHHAAVRPVGVKGYSDLAFNFVESGFDINFSDPDIDPDYIFGLEAHSGVNGSDPFAIAVDNETPAGDPETFWERSLADGTFLAQYNASLDQLTLTAVEAGESSGRSFTVDGLKNTYHLSALKLALGAGSDGFPYSGDQVYFQNLDIKSAVVTPEPASMVLFGLGGAAMAFARRRMKA